MEDTKILVTHPENGIHEAKVTEMKETEAPAIEVMMETRVTGTRTMEIRVTGTRTMETRDMETRVTAVMAPEAPGQIGLDYAIGAVQKDIMLGIVRLLYQQQIDHRTISGTVEVVTEVIVMGVVMTVGTMIHRMMIIKTTANRTVPAVVADEAVGGVEIVQEDQEAVTRMIGSPHRMRLSRKSKMRDQLQPHRN